MNIDCDDNSINKQVLKINVFLLIPSLIKVRLHFPFFSEVSRAK